MSSKAASQKSYLETKFGTRVNFSRTERKLYGHDIAEIPSLVKPLIGNTIPDAVVQPQSEEELSDLVRWASQNRVPAHPTGQSNLWLWRCHPHKKRCGG